MGQAAELLQERRVLRDASGGDKSPYDMIRGNFYGTNWPSSARVDDDSFPGSCGQGAC